jgi:hypothetical protein
MNSRHRFVLGLVVVMALAHPLASQANRCKSGISVSSGLHCQCPDFAALLADPTAHTHCPPGWTPILYNIDPNVPFIRDGSVSYATTYGEDNTQCSGLSHTSPLRGQVVGCWGPVEKSGCRHMKMADDGACLSIDEVPTSPSTTTGIVAVANAGASLRVCPPIDSNTSCRATKGGGTDDNVRFWWGGFCATDGCTGTTINADACNAAWGATYFGYNHYRGPDVVPVASNWYDWSSGQWKILSNNSHINCGDVLQCLGNRRRAYTMQAVLVPAPGYQPPCLPSGDPCKPSTCSP